MKKISRSDPRDILRRAANWLERHEWAKDAYALDRDGFRVPPKSPVASKWCASGVIRKVAPSKSSARAAQRLADDVTLGTGGIITFNDKVAENKEQVVAKLREAAQQG